MKLVTVFSKPHTLAGVTLTETRTMVDDPFEGDSATAVAARAAAAKAAAAHAAASKSKSKKAKAAALPEPMRMGVGLLQRVQVDVKLARGRVVSVTRYLRRPTSEEEETFVEMGI